MGRRIHDVAASLHITLNYAAIFARYYTVNYSRSFGSRSVLIKTAGFRLSREATAGSCGGRAQRLP